MHACLKCCKIPLFIIIIFLFPGSYQLHDKSSVERYTSSKAAALELPLLSLARVLNTRNPGKVPHKNLFIMSLTKYHMQPFKLHPALSTSTYTYFSLRCNTKILPSIWLSSLFYIQYYTASLVLL